MKGEKHMSTLGYFTAKAGIFPDTQNHVTASHFLQGDVYPFLDQALSNLISTIEENGEFELYVDMLAEKQEQAQKELRQRERERRRLAMGDDFDSALEEHSEDEKKGSRSSSSGSNSSSYDSSSDDDKKNKSGLNTPLLSQNSRKSKKHEEQPDPQAQVAKEFNAVRFLGNTLKKLAQEARAQNKE